MFYHRGKLFDEKDQAVIHFADLVTRSAATIRDADLDNVRQHFSEEQIVELVLTVCAANFTNRVNDSLLSDPDLGE